MKKTYYEKVERINKKCEICGKPFETAYKNQRLCKGPHFKTCTFCGKEFQPSVRQLFLFLEGKEIFCNKKHAMMYHHNQRIDNKQVVWNKKLTPEDDKTE